MELTKEQKQEWEQWLSERPENVRKVAERIVPWKKYRDTRITDDIGNRYSPRSYARSRVRSISKWQGGVRGFPVSLDWRGVYSIIAS